MPRGCDNPNARFNNQPSAAPWTWSKDEREISLWRSNRHTLRVVKDGVNFAICTEFGRYLRGPKGRVRFFKTTGAAQLAADIEKGVA